MVKFDTLWTYLRFRNGRAIPLCLLFPIFSVIFSKLFSSFNPRQDDTIISSSFSKGKCMHNLPNLFQSSVPFYNLRSSAEVCHHFIFPLSSYTFKAQQHKTRLFIKTILKWRTTLFYYCACQRFSYSEILKEDRGESCD